MNTSVKKIKWDDNDAVSSAVDYLSKSAGFVVSPTKVGYIIMVTDEKGLEYKFSAKNRNKNKPAVVLCSTLEQLQYLAETNSEIVSLYEKCLQENILLGCILPWKKPVLEQRVDSTIEKYITDTRQTSCFVMNFGITAEKIVKTLWEDHSKLTFASSANPSGKGNKGLVKNIGDRIETAASLIIDGDDYVASIQPDKDINSRYEQGVMVSMVDNSGKLVPVQANERNVEPVPTVIRKGLDIDKILRNMSNIFLSWNYRHGDYY